MAYKLDLGIGVKVLSSDLKAAEKQLDALYKKYDGKAVTPVTEKKTNAPLKTYNSEVKKATKNTMGLVGQMKEAISKSITWGASMSLLYGSIRKVREAFDFTVEVDARMTEIAQVTGQTREQVQGLEQDYLNLAVAMKASTEEVLESAVALYRQGLNAQEVEERLTQITMAAQTAGVSIQQATDFVTVGINAMNVSAESFNDVLLKTASISATDYQSLGEMVQKTGASFANANIELEKGVSWLAQVQETSRLASTTVGTAFKTIIARYSKVNEEGLDNTEVLNDIEKAYAKAGISIRDFDNQLRPIDQLIDELAGKWDTLDINTQNYIKTTVAGVRQGDIFLQLMNGYSRSLDIYDEAMDSAGTTTEQYNLYLESLNAKLAELENSWKKFYNSLMDSDTVGDFLDFIIKAVDALTWLNDNVGILNIAFPLLITKLVMANAEFLKLAITAVPAFIDSMVYGLGVTQSLTVAMDGATISANLLAGALTLGLAVAITSIISGVVSMSKEIRQAEENYKGLIDTIDGTESASEKVKILRDRIAELNEELDASNVKSRIAEEYKYLDTLEEGTMAYADQLVVIRLLEGEIRELTKTEKLLNDELRAQASLDANQKHWETYIQQQIKASGTTEELASDTKSLSEALVELAEEGEISDETLLSMANNQQAIQFALTATEEDIIKLATVYGRTADEIVDIQEFLTNELIRQTQLRMTSIATEILALEAEANAIMSSGGTLTEGQQRELYGAGRGLSEALFEIEQYSNRLDDLNVISEKYSGLMHEITEQTEDTAIVTEEATDVLSEYTQKLKEQEAILNKIESDREAINTLTDLTVDLIKQENDEYKNQLENRKDALEVAKEEADLQKELAGLNKDKSDIEDELLQLRLDGSENVNARILELEQELADKQTEIDETVEEDAYDKKIDILDDEIDAIDDYLDKEGKLREDAMERINESYADGTSELYDQLIEYNNIYGTSIEQDITTAWEAATQALKSYNSELGSVDVAETISDIDVAGVQAQMASNSAQWWLADTQAEKDALHAQNLELGASVDASYNSGTGEWSFPSYDVGTPYVPSDQLAMIHEGEAVIPADYNPFTNMMPDVNIPNIESNSNSSTTTIGSLITVQGSIDSTNIGRVESAANQVAEALRNTANKQGLKNISIM